MLQAAVAAGVDHIDTAQYYGPGVVNDLIREALHPYPGGLAIVSKVAVRRDDYGAVLPFDDPDQLREGIEDNLRSLRVGQLPAVNLRLPGDGRADARFDDQLAVMLAARDEGLIAWVGLSNVSLEQLRHAVEGTDIACVQNLVHLADRRGAPLLAECLSRGIAFVPFCPLGWPLGQKNPVLTSQVVIETAARLGITPSQVALQWLPQLAPNVLLIPGTGSVAHLREDLPPKASRSMTRRCANWTPLHHGQTIRLERYWASPTSAVAPGFTDSPAFRVVNIDEQYDATVDRQTLRRRLTPDDTAAAPMRLRR